MNIAFDASDICTNRADGTTRYTRELMARLPGMAKDDHWNFYGPCAAPTGYVGPTSPSLRAGLRGAAHENTLWKTSISSMGWTQSKFAWQLFKDNPDVLFMPIQQLPILRRKKMKTVAVIHDLAFHEYGPQFRMKDYLLLHTFSAQVAREADAIIAVSDATKQDIKKYYGREKNVFVVHHGIDHDRFKLFSDTEKQDGFKKLQEQYPELKNNYILFVGQIQPRKNIERLVEAFELMQSRAVMPGSDPTSTWTPGPAFAKATAGRQARGDKLQLVIAGGHGWHNKEIYQRIEKSPARKNILLTGAVPDELLPTLYANAQAFVLPSLQEGFGIPLIEAAACGTPVITSNCSSMKEIMEGAGTLIDPLSAESMADGIQETLRHRETIAARCIHRAQQFSWDITARQTLDILRRSGEQSRKVVTNI